MKNLNATSKKITKPALVTMKFVCSFGAVLLTLTFFLSMKSRSYNAKIFANGAGMINSIETQSTVATTDPIPYGSGIGNPDTSVVFETVEPGRDWYMNGFYTSDYGLTNNWGASNSGNDRWIKLVITKSGVLRVSCGTISGYDIYDSVIHLVDSTGAYELSSGDDGNGSYALGGVIEYNIEPGTYYVVLDGTDKDGHVKNGGVGIDFDLTY